MINPNVKKIIETNPMALATVDNKKPYVIAVAFCKVVSNTEILITDNFMGRTLENIDKNKNVALVVWSGFVGYQFLGTCKYFKTGKWVDYARSLKENKKLSAKGAILVKINKIIQSK